MIGVITFYKKLYRKKIYFAHSLSAEKNRKLGIIHVDNLEFKEFNNFVAVLKAHFGFILIF